MAPDPADEPTDVVDLGDALPDELGKADSRDLAFDALPIPSGAPESATSRRRLITSSSEWRTLFRSNPAGIDFAHEWAVYYGAGSQPSDGFAAEVRGIRIASDFRSLIVTTVLVAPGRACTPDPRPESPEVLVKFTRPTTPPGAVSWLRQGEGRDCAPPPASDCAAIHCARGTYCDERSGAARCVPYATCALSRPACPAGTRCEDLPAQCFRLPCPPTTPSCEPYACPSAAAIRCGGRVLLSEVDACHGAYHDWIVASCPGVTFSYDA